MDASSVCVECLKAISKYKCPKCAARTCSLVCSKNHKILQKCDGQRPAWDPSNHLHDQVFIDKGRQLIDQIDKRQQSPIEQQQQQDDESKEISNRIAKRLNILRTNCMRRRIWLNFNDKQERCNEPNDSYYESYSDTIFWTIQLDFVGKDLSTIYTYRVNNIPDTLTMNTLLRQFIEPKKIGSIVSASDLDSHKMADYQSAGMDAILLFMRVPDMNAERYYIVEKTKSLLDNFRNRTIINYPTILVCLDNEADKLTIIDEKELIEYREVQRKKRQIEHGNDESIGAGQNNRGRSGRGGSRRLFDRRGNGRNRQRGAGGGGRGRGRGRTLYRNLNDNRNMQSNNTMNYSYSTNRFDQRRNNDRCESNNRFNEGRNWHETSMKNSLDLRISRPTYGMQHDDLSDKSMLNAWNTAVINPMNKSTAEMGNNNNNATTVMESMKKKSKNYLNILGGDFNDTDIVSD